MQETLSPVQPLDAIGIVTQTIRLVVVFPPQVGEGFIDGTRLIKVIQIGFILRHTVRKFMRYDVICEREITTKYHLGAAPEGIVVWAV